LRIIGSSFQTQLTCDVTQRVIFTFFKLFDLSEQELVTSPLYKPYSSEQKWTKVKDPCIYFTGCITKVLTRIIPSSHVKPSLRRFLRRQRTPELNHLHCNDMAPPWHPPFTLGSGRLKYLPLFSATLPMRHDITFLLTLPATHRTQ
jgi:hypothetical protein